jgi:hypothetical protein
MKLKEMFFSLTVVPSAVQINRLFSYQIKRRITMATKPTKGVKPFVWVKDKKGNQFICPIDALKDPQKATQKELKNCVDDAKMGVNIGD